jgi:hypothetical protein
LKVYGVPDLLMTFTLTSCPLSLKQGAGVNHHIIMDFLFKSQKRKEKVSGEWSTIVADNIVNHWVIHRRWLKRTNNWRS